jgi:hypothetical protein
MDSTASAENESFIPPGLLSEICFGHRYNGSTLPPHFSPVNWDKKP